jgi:hypothetical protein
MIHETIGHLGIFVSGGVAKKEHGEFSSNIDLIDTLPPGLYEAVLENKAGDTANPDLVTGNWVMRCEARTLDDIRALGGNDADDERRFATAARVSDFNLSLYRALAQPVIRALVNPLAAQWMQKLHPLRLQFELFSDANPLTAPIAGLAERVRKDRRSVGEKNPFVAMQENVSRRIEAGLDAWRDMNEAFAERTFLAIYGSPTLQAAVGIDPDGTRPLRKAPRSVLHRELLENRIAELKSRIPHGGQREAVIRALLYAGMTTSTVDERGFELTRRIREAYGRMPLSEFKALVRDQFHMLLIDREGALKAIPSMLPADTEARHKALDLIRQVLGARGSISPETERRLQELARLFAIRIRPEPAIKEAALRRSGRGAHKNRRKAD